LAFLGGKNVGGKNKKKARDARHKTQAIFDLQFAICDLGNQKSKIKNRQSKIH
jgi:hypothetical protein